LRRNDSCSCPELRMNAPEDTSLLGWRSSTTESPAGTKTAARAEDGGTTRRRRLRRGCGVRVMPSQTRYGTHRQSAPHVDPVEQTNGRHPGIWVSPIADDPGSRLRRPACDAGRSALRIIGQRRARTACSEDVGDDQVTTGPGSSASAMQAGDNKATLDMDGHGGLAGTVKNKNYRLCRQCRGRREAPVGSRRSAGRRTQLCESSNQMRAAARGHCSRGSSRARTVLGGRGFVRPPQD